MKKETRLLVFTIIVSILSITLIVIRYEKLLLQQKNTSPVFTPVKGGLNLKEFTAPEIIEKIKLSKDYLGDSITIFEDGRMVTSNSKFQGTINAVVNSPDNMAIVKNNCNTNGLPQQYNIYMLAAQYYKDQYPDEFKQKK